jgi:cupin 2 domain-containing protein
VSVAANLLADLPPVLTGEVFTDILARPGVRIERIVSQGQTTPDDTPYLQAHEEWVLLLAGRAELWLEGSGTVTLGIGDHLLIPANVPHRVTFTAPDEPTVWLALHFGETRG